jgi:UPF0716 family protein affecting phage T7 exclusion
MMLDKRLTIPNFMRVRALQTLDMVDRKLAGCEGGRLPEDSQSKRLPAWMRCGLNTLLGVFLIVAGVLMLVLPGPGIVAILLGLSVLAGQFIWARRLLARISCRSRQALA